MSVVTNVLLTHGILESEEVKEAVREPAPRPGAAFEQRLNLISDGDAGDHWGGSKWPEVDLWAAAFNHIDIEAFCSQVAAIPWKEPELVQLFIQGQWADKFDVWEFRNGEFVCVLGEGLVTDAAKFVLLGSEQMIEKTLIEMMSDQAIEEARDKGCVCTFPDVWMKSSDKVQWDCVVVDHEECVVLIDGKAQPDGSHRSWMTRVTRPKSGHWGLSERIPKVSIKERT